MGNVSLRLSRAWLYLIAAVLAPLVAASMLLAFSEHVMPVRSSVPVFLSAVLGLPFAYKAAGRRAPWLAVLYLPVMLFLILGYLALLALAFNRFEL